MVVTAAGFPSSGPEEEAGRFDALLEEVEPFATPCCCIAATAAAWTTPAPTPPVEEPPPLKRQHSSLHASRSVSNSRTR